MFIFKSNAIFSQKVERMNKNKRSFSYFAFIESREKNLQSPFSEINRDRLRVENTEKYICKNAHHRHFEVDPKWAKLLNERISIRLVANNRRRYIQFMPTTSSCLCYIHMDFA